MARDYKLEINPEKTQYAIFNRLGNNIIRLAGQDIKSKRASTYLGISNHANTNLPHLKKRLEKARRQTHWLRGVFATYPTIPVQQKLIITKACLHPTFLYGMETCTDSPALTKFCEKFEVLHRRILRPITGAPGCCCNETIYRDLGW